METIPKTLLIDSLAAMPDEIIVEQVIEQIILISKVERSRRQIDNGQFLTQDDLKESYKEWLE